MFQQVVQNLTTSHHPCPRTLSKSYPPSPGSPPPPQTGLPAPALTSLLTILNAAARVSRLEHKPHHGTLLLRFLRWLPISLRNESQSPHKAFKVFPCLTPNHLFDLLPTPLCRLILLQPQGFLCGSLNRHQVQSILRSFALPVPSNWNFLPSVANTASAPSLNLYSDLAF